MKEVVTCSHVFRTLVFAQLNNQIKIGEDVHAWLHFDTNVIEAQLKK